VSNIKQRCPLRGKICYAREENAERARSEMEVKHPLEVFRVYECPHCFNFHVGHGWEKIK